MNLVSNFAGRKITFTLLYLIEGAPIGYIWWALPTHLRSSGVPVEAITHLTALLVIPWMLKFLWAPLVDALRSPRFGYRAWIFCAQLVMGLSILPLVWLDLQRDYSYVVALLLAHGFAAATQDVAIDGWAIAITPDHEKGRISGYMQVGMIVGRWFFGAGLLLVQQWVSVPVCLFALAFLILTSSILVLTGDEAELSSEMKSLNLSQRISSFFEVLRNALLSKMTWWGLLFATISGAGFSAVGTVVGPYLVDRGFTEVEIGWFYSATVIAMLLGSWLGGVIADKWQLVRGIGAFLIFMSFLIVLIALIDYSSGVSTSPTTQHSVSTYAIFWLLVILHAGGGLFTASTYALFMHLSDPKLGGTQFSTYMGGINACDSWSSYSIGLLIGWGSYSSAFAIMAILSLVSLFLLPPIFNKNKLQTVPA